MDDFLPILVGLAIWLYPSLCIYRIASKTRTDSAWMAWVPILNIYLICKIGDQSGIWVLLCLIPFVGPILLLVLLIQLPKALGITTASRFLIVVPGINLIYLGYLAFAVPAPPEPSRDPYLQQRDAERAQIQDMRETCPHCGARVLFVGSTCPSCQKAK